jgi:hypothetical protein
VWASACGAVTANAVPTSSNVVARRLKVMRYGLS